MGAYNLKSTAVTWDEFLECRGLNTVSESNSKPTRHSIHPARDELSNTWDAIHCFAFEFGSFVGRDLELLVGAGSLKANSSETCFAVIRHRIPLAAPQKVPILLDAIQSAVENRWYQFNRVLPVLHPFSTVHKLTGIGFIACSPYSRLSCTTITDLPGA